ncbi:Aste57867_8525 [Aphanomyces stellatus]|uniref:Aste57867_8525 protein n=1 Tax=Aphanomyces stellatus TaxID=120398 RepID=A0A485KKK0_9STRA|nr:hypothetical protein As57867_008493 [Aphanomyces stellatus]VFT85411.1 Aste57867_8525 [Aphanomyces stellatus]
MKFGKRMRCLASPEWEGGYVDYKGLKRRVKTMTGSEEARSAEFHQALLRELSKVNASFFWILDDLTKQQETDAQIAVSSPQHRYEVLQQQLASVLELSNRIDALRRFVVLNYLAVVKISKKFDKTVDAKLKPDITSDLLLQPFYAGSYVDQLYSQTAALVDSLVQSLAPNTRPSSSLHASCPICLYHLTSPVTLSCTHTFCWSCLAKAAEHHIHACPLCRQVQSIDPRDYEIDGLIKRFVRMYASVLDDLDADAPPAAILKHALDVATKHSDAIQMQYAMAPSATLPLADVDSSEGEATAAVAKVLLPRVAAIAHATTAQGVHQALAGGCHMVALDVQVCASGDVVVCRDAVVDVDGAPRFVGEMTGDELLAALGVLPLARVLELVRQRAAVYINVTTDGVIAPLMALLAAACENAWTASMLYVASGNHYQLLAVNGYRTSHAALQGLHSVVTTSSIPLGYCQTFEQLHVSHVCVETAVVTKPFVQDAHSRGIHVFVGVIDHENIAWKVLEEIGDGIDGIISNVPDMLSATLMHHALAQERRRERLPNYDATTPEAAKSFAPGDPVELLCDGKWYAGVILGVHAGTTYSILWWTSDNSQRRATKVPADQLRAPMPQYRASYLGHGIDVAFGAIKAAFEWATFPFTASSHSSASAA